MTESFTEPPSAETALSPERSLNWQDQDGLLRELWLRNEKPSKIAGQLGRSVAAIMTRAARLGLPRRAAPGRKPGYQRKDTVRKAASSLSKVTALRDVSKSNGEATAAGIHSVRICLMCLNRFPSEGRHNRICPNCKGSADYNTGSGIPDMFKDA